MPAAPWETKLAEELALLYDRLSAERVGRRAAMPKSSDGDLAIFSAGRFELTRITPEERSSFREQNNCELEEVLQTAFGVDGILSHSKQARQALVRLVSWDLRYLFSPAVYLALRYAQVANDRALLRAIGQAMSRNDRYDKRGLRSQRLLTRVLVQLAFDNEKAYHSERYQGRVRNALLEVYDKAKVPKNNPAWNVLTEPKYFHKHLRRIGLL